MSLSALLGPATVTDIAAAFDGRRPAYIPGQDDPGQDDERSAKAPGWNDFVAILNLYPISSPDLRIFKNGKPIPPNWLNGASNAAAIDGKGFRALARQGVTIFLNHVERRSPAMHDLWREAQAAFGHPLELAYVATFGSGYGLESHFDKVDHVAFQVAGAKDWEILGEAVDIPAVTESIKCADSPVTRRLTMRAGDVLVLPYGLGHRCFVQESSLQLGILIDRPHSLNYVEWLTKKAGKLPQCRRPAPFDRENPAALARHEAEIEQMMRELMKTFPPAAFLAEQTRWMTSDVTVADLPDTAAKR